MSTLIVPWLVFPAVLRGAVARLRPAARARRPACGCRGRSSCRAASPCWRSSRSSRRMTAATARLATPAVIVAALAGLRARAARSRGARRLDRWAVGRGGRHVRGVRGADRALGQGDVRGLDQARRRLDAARRCSTARWTHGRDLSGLEPSTYLRVLDLLLIHGYPLATLHAARRRPPDRRRRRALALPADDGRDGGDARARRCTS